MKILAAGALLGLLALPAAAVEPYLVKDINTAAEPAGSDPASPVAFRGAVLFFARDGISGSELWRSDGTSAGTFQLSSGGGLAAPQPYLVTEHLYFFVSADPIGGFPSLWVSDGTPAGTFRLTDPGVTVDGRPRVWIASQGVLYFTGRDEEHGIELWRTDGTPAGTRLVADLRPGPLDSDVSGLTEYKGQAWFGADDGQRGGSLWRSDGTAAGTVLAVDPFPASAVHEAPEYVQAVNGRITFFTARPGLGSLIKQLWGGDGTARGTSLISSAKTLYDRIVRGNRLYFLAESKKGQELWVSDGTGPGTRPLTNFPKHEAFPFRSLPREGLSDGRFVFWANDGTHGDEPWITDGTPKGTRLLRDLCRGECSSFGSRWALFGGRLYFSLLQGSLPGFELWSTDGTRAGTRRVSGKCPEICFSSLSTPIVAGDQLLFAARDAESGAQIWSTNGNGMLRVTDLENPFVREGEEFHGAVLDGVLLFRGEDGEHGAELWRTDGTASGTGLVEDINRSDIGGSFPRSLRPLGDEVVFVVAKRGGAPELWKSDGTAAGTVRFRTMGPDEPDGADAQGEVAEVGGVLFYSSYGVPWRTDGTEAGTFRLSGPNLPVCCAEPEMQAVGSTVFFELQDQEHGNERWATDGTQEGTRLVLDILPGPGGAYARNLTAFQGRLWFTADSPGIGVELWTSDGTAAGTVPFMDINPGAGNSAPRQLTVHAGRLWFFADDGEHGRELWSSDGTEAGTVLAAEIQPGEASVEALLMVSLGDRLVFSLFGSGLWASDGTPAGTRKIWGLEIDSLNRPVVWTIFQGRLYYSAGGILWVSDGTEEGTGPFSDRDGNRIFSPERFAVLGDRLVFTAQNLFGPALWESDGTPEGTFPVQPPVAINSPRELVGAGDRVFFPSNDGATGWELWAVRP